MGSDSIKKLAEYMEECSSITFFGGAGVSTESGVPDFRSKDGLYNQHDVKFDMFWWMYEGVESVLKRMVCWRVFGGKRLGYARGMWKKLRKRF